MTNAEMLQEHDQDADSIFEDADAANALAEEALRNDALTEEDRAKDQATIAAWQEEAAQKAREEALRAIGENPMPDLVDHGGAIVTRASRDAEAAAGQQVGGGSYDGRARY